MKRPSQATVKRLLSYTPSTGVFVWRVASNRWGRTPPGAVAGTIRPDGRRHIYIDGKNYLSARLAVLWMTGRWPLLMVDHKDGDKGNDRWKNLRVATRGQNAQNSKKPRHNTSGFKGVTAYPYTPGKWIAQLKHQGRHVSLGVHDTPEAAHLAYLAGAAKYFGEFSRGG